MPSRSQLFGLPSCVPETGKKMRVTKEKKWDNETDAKGRIENYPQRVRESCVRLSGREALWSYVY